MAKEFSPASHYAIVRAQESWEVAIRRDGVRHYRHFRDERFGSNDLALQAAQAWRDELVRTHLPSTRQERASKKTIATKKTGISGVTCWLNKKGAPTLWRAKTRVGDVVLQNAFSVSRWGDEAWSMAIAQRARQLLQLEGLAHVHPAERAIREAEVLPGASGKTSPTALQVRWPLRVSQIQAAHPAWSSGGDAAISPGTERHNPPWKASGQAVLCPSRFTARKMQKNKALTERADQRRRSREGGSIADQDQSGQYPDVAIKLSSQPQYAARMLTTAAPLSARCGVCIWWSAVPTLSHNRKVFTP